MVDAEPLADAPAHGDAVGVGSLDAEVVEDGNSVVGELTGGVALGIARLVALPGPNVVEGDDAVAVREIVADVVPHAVVAALAGDEEQRFAGTDFFVVERKAAR